MNFSDVIYSDPVGPLPTRPMTAAGKRDDDFGDEELGDDLLPVWPDIYSTYINKSNGKINDISSLKLVIILFMYVIDISALDFPLFVISFG